ncbi:MAG TPA: YbhB/YbcL family Raf kinase inhibitor-like protein [Asanoa sp.]
MTNLERPAPPGPYDVLPSVPSFSLTSDDLQDGKMMDKAHAHESVGGDNVSPHLSWSGFPPQTRGFAVTCYDPDAPTGSGFWHWSLINLPASVTELPRGAAEDAGDGRFSVRNDYGATGYGGAAPPYPDVRPHRYYFAVHALDVDRLDVPPEGTPAAVGFNLTFHVLARGVLQATYEVSP